MAIHVACQALSAGECDLALAGGVTIKLPQVTGYLYEDNAILSADGRVRPFDADASGTVLGNGVGVVVLRALCDAVTAGDTIHAVIKGTATNNDGSRKVGFAAPGRDGQAAAIADAHAVAGVDPDTIGYVEAHGTATSARRSGRGGGADERVPAGNGRARPLCDRLGQVERGAPRRRGGRRRGHQGGADAAPPYAPAQSAL